VKIIVDSNIIISAALFPHSKTAFVFSHILVSHEVIICSYSIEECRNVFIRKFPDRANLLSEFLENLVFTQFKTPNKINVAEYPKLRDAADLPILVSAIKCDADILLTGDKDFDDLDIQKPLIYTPSQYFELIS